MSHLITKLTKKQEESIPLYIEKWVNKASEPIDRKKTLKITKQLFGADKTVLIAESIQNAINIVRFIADGKKLEEDRQLRSQLDSQLDRQLDSQLHRQLHRQLYSQLYSQLGSQLGNQLDNQLRSQLHNQLYSQLGSQLHNQLGSQLGSQLRSQNITYSFYTTQFWLAWFGCYDFAESIGVKFDKEKLNRMTDIVLNIPTIITLGKILIIIENPKCRWFNGNLHSDTRPAIEWKDGTGIYFLNAVRFEKELWEKVVSGEMSFADRLKIKDVDQRTQAINPRYTDIDAFIKEANGVVLDDYNKFDVNGNEVNYKLYKFPAGDIFQKDAYYCYFDCPSTRKKHLEGVEVSKTVPEAMAWAEEITENQWKLRVPLVEEV